MTHLLSGSTVSDFKVGLGPPAEPYEATIWRTTSNNFHNRFNNHALLCPRLSMDVLLYMFIHYEPKILISNVIVGSFTPCTNDIVVSGLEVRCEWSVLALAYDCGIEHGLDLLWFGLASLLLVLADGAHYL